MPSSQGSIDNRPFKFLAARQSYPHNPHSPSNRAAFLIRKANLDESEQQSRRRLVHPIRKNLSRLCTEQLGKNLEEGYIEPMKICLFLWPGAQDGSFKGGNWCFWTLQTKCQTFILSSRTRKYYAYLGPEVGMTEYPVAESVTVKSRKIIEGNHKMSGYLCRAKGIEPVTPTNAIQVTPRQPTQTKPSPMLARLATLKRKKPSSSTTDGSPPSHTRQKLHHEHSMPSIASSKTSTPVRRPIRPLQDLAVNSAGPRKMYRSTH